MGTILWTPHWIVREKFVFPRNYIWGLAIGWQPGSTVVSPLPNLVLEEHVYGGYRKHLKFVDKFYPPSTIAFTADYVLEDYYVTPPGSSVKISNGDVYVDCHTDSDHLSPLYILADAGSSHFFFFPLPSPPPTYWGFPLP
jgi:hypothetical protein